MFLPYCVQASFGTYLPYLVHQLGVSWDAVGHEVGTINSICHISSGVGHVTTAILLAYISCKNVLVVMIALLGISILTLSLPSDLMHSRTSL